LAALAALGIVVATQMVDAEMSEIAMWLWLLIELAKD
jgi:hypothetical protein